MLDVLSLHWGDGCVPPRRGKLQILFDLFHLSVYEPPGLVLHPPHFGRLESSWIPLCIRHELCQWPIMVQTDAGPTESLSGGIPACLAMKECRAELLPHVGAHLPRNPAWPVWAPRQERGSCDSGYRGATWLETRGLTSSLGAAGHRCGPRTRSAERRLH